MLRELDEHGGTCLADIRGSGAVYTAGRDETAGWFCSCPAWSIDCAHVLAVKGVTALEPRRGRS